MKNLHDRLVEYFTTVFPTRTPDTAVTASANTVAQWDSAHHILLRTVIQEEFKLPVSEEVLANIDSFEGVERYVSQLYKAA
jgi:acyl carrier protein